MRERFGAARPVFVAASTRDGEEALLLDAIARGAPAAADADGDRAAPSAALRRGGGAARRARARVRAPQRGGAPVAADVGFVLGDTLGELPAYYAAADVAFVGGSLLPLGGQNLIEPIAVGTPTLVGPHTFNFAEAADARRSRRARRCASRTPMRWSREVADLLNDAARRDADAGRGARVPRRASRRGGSAVGVARAAAGGRADRADPDRTVSRSAAG